MPQLMMERIRIYNEQYRAGDPQISDEHYDSLLEDVQSALSPKLYELFRISLREPGGDIALDYKVGSLKKCTYGTDQFSNFIDKYDPKQLLVSAKLDGMGYVANYVNGVLISCSTTGDGNTGEDITHTAKFVLPNMINVEGHLIVRGEFIMVKHGAIKYGYRNARNGIVGLMKTHEPNFDVFEYARCPAYEILNSDENRVNQYSQLEKIGFEIPVYTTLTVNPLTEEKLKEMLVELKEGSYLIDGLVICEVDDYPENSLLPDRTVAFKVNLDVATTKVIGMDINASKDGKLRGVALLETVDLAGTDVKRATIYNFKNVLENKIGPGAEVIVTKAGDIIPKILEVVKPADIQYEAYWELCPTCGTPTRVNGVDLECPNKNCESKTMGAINAFIRRNEIKGASPVSLQKWNIETFEDLLSFQPVGRSAEKFYDDFKAKVFTKSKEEILKQFNWGGVGRKTIAKYVEMVGFENFLKAALLNDMPHHPHGCGDKSWEKIIEKFDENYANFKLIVNDPRYNPTKVEKQEVGDSLQGKSFCCTGKVSRPRKEIEADIKAAGGEIKSVSKNLDYLIAGEKAGSKLAKAQSLGIKIISEDQLMDMLN